MEILKSIDIKKISEKKEGDRVVYFSDNTLKKLKDITNKSEKFEYSANLCAKKGKGFTDLAELYVNYIRKGERFHVTHLTDKNRYRCDRDKEYIGGFHTHPRRQIIKPSIKDLMFIDYGKENFECIGSKHSKEKIKCFTSVLLNKKEIEIRDNVKDRLNKISNILNKVSREDFKRYEKIFHNERDILETYLLNNFYDEFDPREKKNVVIRKTYDKLSKIL